MAQLLRIYHNLHLARQVVQFLKSDLPPLPVIQSIREVISVQKKLEDEIDRCIISEDEMARLEKDVQKLLDDAVATIDKYSATKEKEIMEV